jgi:ketosteroid isomerase-like protein
MSIQRPRFRNIPWLIAGLFLFFTTTNITAMAQAGVEETNRQVVKTGFDNWRRGIGSVFDLLASDAKWTITGQSTAAGTYQSRRDFLDQVIVPFNARLLTPLVPTVHGIYADGDMIMVLFDAAAIARDGKQYENTYSWYLKMHDGKIVSATAFFDSIAFNDLWKRVRPER